MRSKTKKKKKRVNRKGEKLITFFKRGTMVLLAVVFVALAVLSVKWVSPKFYVKEIVVAGNYHLDEADVISSAGINMGAPLFKVEFSDLDQRLRENAWIKKVALRKQYPGTIMINIEEAVPKALLSRKDRLYLIDAEGELLERIEGETTPFLPVIKGINPKNKKGMTEALKLIEVLATKNSLVNRESIEIGQESYGLTMHIDGEFIKVGYGNYSKKFDRWIELEPEIRKKGVAVKYVDLRFKDSVIVKPIKETKGKRSS